MTRPRSSISIHQLSVWAIVQNTLDFFESGAGLGRRISWAFEGNRLIIVPHAGYGENAYYDRASKSLQFYWFDSDKGTVFTCLSTDIVNHEFGHAVLDGLRPYYFESVGAQTAAFHEFMGDLTAILMAFRNNAFRKVVLKESNGKLVNATAARRPRPRVQPGDQERPISAHRPEQEDHEEARRQSRAACIVGGADRSDVRHPHGGVRQAPEKRGEALEGRPQQASRATGERSPTPFPACRCSPSSRSICCRHAP